MFVNIRSKSSVLLLTLVAAFVFAACALTGASVEAGGGGGSISFTATANGDASQATTKINLVFSADVPDLTAANIAISGSDGEASKGVLTKTDNRNWTLNVTTTKRGQAEVSVTISGVGAGKCAVRFYLPPAPPLTISVSGGFTGGFTVRYVDNPSLIDQKTISGTIAANGTATLLSQPPNGALIVSILAGSNTIYVGRVVDSTITLTLKLDSSGTLEFRPADSGKIPIGTYSEFQLIRTNTGTLSGSYKQEADIDLMGNGGLSVPDWTPIGTSASAFTGNYDGDGKHIMRLYINNSNGDDAGLFGMAGGSAILSTVNIASGSVTGRSHVGGLLGRTTDSSSGTISECSNAASITGRSYIGGVVGCVYNKNWTISGCSNSGNVSSSSASSDFVGGVLGASLASITRCSNSGNIENADTAGYTGGVVGYMTGPAFGVTGDPVGIFASYNTGNVTGGCAAVGGVLGSSVGKLNITACYNTGRITGNNISYTTVGDVGGVFGGASLADNANSFREIIACYNTGDVSSGRNIGGVSGYLHIADSIIASYNTGNITDGLNTRSILGSGYGFPISCYWLTGTASGAAEDPSRCTSFTGNFTPDTSDNGAPEWRVGDSTAGKYWKDGTTNGSTLPKLWYQD